LFALSPEPLPFERVSADVRTHTMHWQGRVEQIVGTLAAAPEPLPASLCWYPDRLLGAVLDGRRPEGTDRIQLVEDTAAFALEACRGVRDGVRLESIQQQLGQHGLMRHIVRHSYDPWSLTGTDPERSRHTADWLLNTFRDSLLIVPLGHGGLPVGSQVGALLRQAGMNAQDAAIYPLLFSRAKRFQWHPRITQEELDYLRIQSYGRQVVVLDEDAKTGTTVSRAVRFLRGHGIAGKAIAGVVNHDRRTHRRQAKQGVHWENA
jgi:hypothetical protein